MSAVFGGSVKPGLGCWLQPDIRVRAFFGLIIGADMIALHIGTPKAGSASLQNFLDKNSTVLRSMSVDYPRVGRSSRKSHNGVAKALRQASRTETPCPEVLRELCEHIKNGRFNVTVISAETFTFLKLNQIYELKKALSDTGQPFKIILIIRDLLDQIVSSYGQKIRYGGNTYDFDTYFESQISEAASDAFVTAGRWADEFGWEALNVRLLDRAFLLNGDLVEDVLACAGLDIDRPEIRALPPPERINESSGWKCLEAGRAMFSGRHGLDADHALAKCLSAIRRDTANKRQLRDAKLLEKCSAEIARESGWDKDRGRYLTRSQALRCLEIYSSAIHNLNGRLSTKLPEPVGLDERGFVEREFLPDACHIPSDELTRHYAQLGARLAEEGLIGKVTGGGSRRQAPG